MSARNRELVNLFLVGLLGTAAYGSAWMMSRMMTSGAWRRIDRSPFANVKPAFSFVCPWLTPGSANSPATVSFLDTRRCIVRHR